MRSHEQSVDGIGTAEKTHEVEILSGRGYEYSRIYLAAADAGNHLDKGEDLAYLDGITLSLDGGQRQPLSDVSGVALQTFAQQGCGIREALPTGVYVIDWGPTYGSHPYIRLSTEGVDRANISVKSKFASASSKILVLTDRVEAVAGGYLEASVGYGSS